MSESFCSAGPKTVGQRHGRTAVFRFYEELNDFLPPDRRKMAFAHSFTRTPSVKDTIEAIGVPHTEVDLILVDGISVGFDRLLTGGERVAVYPMFERLDIAPVSRLRPEPLREIRFVLDVHLGKLARYLRLLGFDTRYRKDCEDTEIIRSSIDERRIVLTRDRSLLKHGSVTHGYWLRNTDPKKQLPEIVSAFDLRRKIHPFTRCMACNTILKQTTRQAVQDILPPKLDPAFDSFSRCPGCRRVYWPGTHYDRLQQIVLAVAAR